MYPRRLLIALGLAAFVGSLVVFAPVSSVVTWLPAEARQPVVDAGGRVLDGYIRVEGVAGETTWRWQLQPAWVLTLGLGGHWSVEGVGISGNGSFRAWPWHYRVGVLSGSLSGQRLARLAGAAGAASEEPLYLHDVMLAGTPGFGPGSLAGTLSWGPGEVRVAGRPAPLAVPALRGRLSTGDGVVSLHVDGEVEPGADLLTATLDLQSRAMHVAVLGRAATLLGLTGNNPGQSPDQPFVELRQVLR